MTLLRTPLAIAATLALAFVTPTLSHAFGASDAVRTSGSVFALKAAESAAVILDQSFADLTALPQGWVVHANNKGSVAVQNGALVINGLADSYSMTGVSLPQHLLERDNYRIDVQFTFTQSNDNGRWGSIMYRTSAADNSLPGEPYHQFAIRRDATAASGTEFAFRNGGAWNVLNKTPFSEAISADKTYHATVIVHGKRVQQFLNGELLHDVTLSEQYPKGGIGLQTAGLTMRVDRITVTEQTAALPEPIIPVVAAQEPPTQASMAPTLVDLGGAAGAQLSRASNAYFTITPELQLSDAFGTDAGTLLAFLRDESRVTIPALYVDDLATITAMKQLAEREKLELKDMTLISSDIAVLQAARSALPAARTAMHFPSLSSLETDADVLQVAGQTNKAGAKIAILPEGILNKARVAHLQRLLVTVWADSAASTPVEAAQVLLTGVNGVVSANGTVFAEVLAKLPQNTLLRKPIVVGHRGMPGTTDENTLEGARAAAAVGADAIENDIYITTDDVLVVMHDTTVDRTTNGVGPIESMSLAQVKALRTDSGYEVPTLQEFFEEFKDQPITHFIELKSGNPKIVPALKKLIEEQGVEAQSGMISFLGDQLNRGRVELPGITGGFLTSSPNTGNPEQDLDAILSDTQRYSSTFNPNYGGLQRATIEAAKHRGTTFWPWTLRKQDDFYQLYSWGMHGITTDDAHWAKDFPVSVTTTPLDAPIALNTATSVPVELRTQIGNISQSSANTWVYLSGTTEPSVGQDGSLSFSSNGSATLLPGYRHQMSGEHNYVIFGAPLTVQVGAAVPVVDVEVTTPQGGEVGCVAGEQANSAVCSVTAQPGYRIVPTQPGGTCAAGQWDATFSSYTLDSVDANCRIEFTFEAAPVALDLSAVGQTGQLVLGASGGGDGLWRFDTAQAPALQQPSSLPEGVSMPYGVVSFALVDGAEGAAADVVLTYPAALPAGAQYYKFGPTPEQAEPHWYVFAGASISGNTVRLSLQDGQMGDNDLLANGVIRDPGGVGVAAAVAPSNATPVPTTGVMGLLGLSAALAALGIRQRRHAAGAKAAKRA
ncbi:glycerophosphodiester phosphodiesterase family protein [Lampropedia aestuarii]|uniref:glycerophosphodiester phosphodiesterase family protein n=1 Tax=Lampropedia aestuarii TaxID=2562762 RepID=UPI0024697FB1|nr:glycerophosphodiester phosphodiesterase family protein [Lampropedia aestuarii]MDH5858674.1 glycerophosphodiester phosphodiesterase family protein [Lampropedia aestuarii]